MKKYSLLLLIILLFFATGCQEEEARELPKHGVFNLDKDTIKELNNGVIKGTPLQLDKELRMNDIIEVWGEPQEHHDYEDIQRYVYEIKNQRFVINEDEMKEIYSIDIEMDYTKKEIMKAMGKPTMDGNIFIYEKEDIVIQFEKFDEKWRLILRRK